MEHKERPLPLRKAEMRLKLAEISIVQEWSRISLRLRLCLNVLARNAGTSPFELSLEAQVNRWSSRLSEILAQSEERQSLSASVRELRTTLPLRNAIAHGEPGWMPDFPGSYIIFYTLGRARTKPRQKSARTLQPFRLGLFPRNYLDPEDAELYSFQMQDILDNARKMKLLRSKTEQLCDIAVTLDGALNP